MELGILGNYFSVTFVTEGGHKRKKTSQAGEYFFSLIFVLS